MPRILAEDHASEGLPLGLRLGGVARQHPRNRRLVDHALQSRVDVSDGQLFHRIVKGLAVGKGLTHCKEPKPPLRKVIVLCAVDGPALQKPLLCLLQFLFRDTVLQNPGDFLAQGSEVP